VTEPIKVLVVDDSALMRKMIPQMLERDSGIRVVGTAMDGAFALQKAAELKPDVITLDLEMPRMNGIDALRQITKTQQLPVIVVSAHTTEGANTTFKALAMGAFDFVTKPSNGAGQHIDEIATQLTAKIRAAASARKLPAKTFAVPEFPKVQKIARRKVAPSRVIAIGVSTGGPNAVQYVLSRLSADFSGSILIVQHMPEGFTEMFAKRLDSTCAIDVKEAKSGDLLLAGRAVICPGNRHMKIRRAALGNMVVLSDDERVNGHRPSVDVLFRSLAEEFRADAAGVLMTGMGEDGAEGLGLIKSAGGMTIAQNAESCVVYGMPRAAIERGYAIRVSSLETIPNAIQSLCNKSAVALTTS
jgi:two-component system, chemotaxis family, protein-glutamate methylesterase/glutaminase